MPVLLKNKLASHRYNISKRFVAGVSLKGAEVKAIRNHNVQIRNAFVVIRKNEAWVFNMHVNTDAALVQLDPARSRRLLLHVLEIRRLSTALLEKGNTGVVLNLLLTPKGWVKLEIGVGEVKKIFDKRKVKQRQTEKTHSWKNQKILPVKPHPTTYAHLCQQS